MNATTYPQDLAPGRVGWNSWKSSEMATLKAHYTTIGPRALMAMLPGRTYEAIVQRGRRLGLRAPYRPPSEPGQKRASWAHLVDEHFDAVVRRVYQQNPRRGAVQEAATSLGVPREVVRARAVALGVSIPRLKEPNWSPAEDELLEEHAAKTPVVISKLFRKAGFARTASSISWRRRAKQLDRWDPENLTTAQLAEVMGVAQGAVRKWIERHGLKATPRGTARTESQGGDSHTISTKAFRRWISENRQFVDLRKVDRHWFLELTLGAPR